MPPTKTPAPGTLAISPLNLRNVVIELEGESPLIVHAWSEKAKRQIRDKQQGRASAGKAPKDPQAEYEACFYRLADGAPAFKTIAFKAAAVTAATQIAGVTKVGLRGAFHVLGEFVQIHGSEPTMREDMTRVGMGVADMRYRPEFAFWSVKLPVRFNASYISLEQLVHLFNQAGFSVGVGEWRPEKDGMNGMFKVASVEEV